MEFDDFITLATPEGIELEMNLAGAGSRVIAGLIDMAIQLVLAIALTIALGALGAVGAPFVLVGGFIVIFAYHVPFEVLAQGRTPGKRLCRLRVVRSDGSPVDLRSSAARTIARLIDGPALFFLPTFISILVTRNNQRPGDLLADTVVIRTRRAPRGDAPVPAPPATELLASAGDWDVSAIGPDQMAVVRRFLERRGSLPGPARAALAEQLAGGLRPSVTGAVQELSAERFLETLAAAKAARSGQLGR